MILMCHACIYNNNTLVPITYIYCYKFLLDSVDNNRDGKVLLKY